MQEAQLMHHMITRHILHPDIRVTVADKELNYNQICERIDRAKSYLTRERNVQVGEKVLMINVIWPGYLIWFLACAELGLEIVESTSFNKIDHVIGNKVHPSDTIDQFTWKNYPLYETSILTTKDMILFRDVAGAGHSHEFIHNLMICNADKLELNENDACLHTRTLCHHIYFLPTLHRCKNHHWCQNDEYIDVIQTCDINRAIIFQNLFLDVLKKMSPSMRNENLTLYVFGSIPNDVVRHVTEKMQNTIVSLDDHRWILSQRKYS